jgi:hypothetical protein
VADGFSNNTFVGTWTSYKTGKSKKCNFGDYRIPECEGSNGCDIGAGEFSINPKYRENGWQSYCDYMFVDNYDEKQYKKIVKTNCLNGGNKVVFFTPCSP